MNATEPNDWLQALFDESPVAIGFSRDGVMLDANDAYVRLFGYESAAELRGRSLLEQIAPSHRADITERIRQRALGEAQSDRYQTRGLRKDGSEFPFEITTKRVVVADGPLAIAFITDVSEREASNERFRTLSRAATEAVIIHGDGKIILANDTAATMYRFEDAASMIGFSLMELVAPEWRAVVTDQIERRSAVPYEAIARRKDGTTFDAEVHGRTLVDQGRSSRVTIIRDITERKRVAAEQRALAERVREAQKLESLGVLAGGVAHDFNNILTVISNGVALVKHEPDVGRGAMGHLDAIALATERAADLCRQMLAYAGKARVVRKALDLNALVREMSSMLAVSITKKASLDRELASAQLTLLGDATQIQQVVMNLVLNASEAIRGSEGTIVVATGVGTYGAEDFARAVAGEPRAGTYVWLEVRDDGVGMDAATVARMFDPFFTTKFVGRGLGMAAVLGIVRSHAGVIDVESHPGRGTRVRVFFPASDAEAKSARPVHGVLERGAGVVLVVDDEKNVRVTTKLLLEGSGFEVIVARDGIEAIDTLRAESRGVDAVLLDLTMPRMDGAETLRELRRVAPQIPVVLASGYGPGPLEDMPHGAPDAVISKPYAPEHLVATLQRVMRNAQRALTIR